MGLCLYTVSPSRFAFQNLVSQQKYQLKLSWDSTELLLNIQRGLRHKAGPKNTPACGVSGAAGSTVAWTSRGVILWDAVGQYVGYEMKLYGTPSANLR